MLRVFAPHAVLRRKATPTRSLRGLACAAGIAFCSTAACQAIVGYEETSVQADAGSSGGSSDSGGTSTEDGAAGSAGLADADLEHSLDEDVLDAAPDGGFRCCSVLQGEPLTRA